MIRKNVLAPSAISALTGERASDDVLLTQCTALGEQPLSVSTGVAATVAMNNLSFWVAMAWIAMAAAEAGTSTIRSTFSDSYQRRAIWTARSGFDCMSAEISSTGLSKTLPPKCSTASCPAMTEPGPMAVDAKLVRSVSTPILTDFSPAAALPVSTAKTASTPKSCVVRIGSSLPSSRCAQADLFGGDLRAQLIGRRALAPPATAHIDRRRHRIGAHDQVGQRIRLAIALDEQRIAAIANVFDCAQQLAAHQDDWAVGGAEMLA